MSKAELPNLPTFVGFVQTGVELVHPGTAKAAVSNQWLIDRPEERFPFPIRSGRPPKFAVFEGSKPEKEGVNH